MTANLPATEYQRSIALQRSRNPSSAGASPSLDWLWLGAGGALLAAFWLARRRRSPPIREASELSPSGWRRGNARVWVEAGHPDSIAVQPATYPEA